MSSTYVIGHINPDTDSIASAMGYAWLLNERDNTGVIAARAGPTNPQTTWVLKHLGLDAPVLLTDASPIFETVTRRLDTVHPDSPLRMPGLSPVALAGLRRLLKRLESRAVLSPAAACSTCSAG